VLARCPEAMPHPMRIPSRLLTPFSRFGRVPAVWGIGTLFALGIFLASAPAEAQPAPEKPPAAKPGPGNKAGQGKKKAAPKPPPAAEQPAAAPAGEPPATGTAGPETPSATPAPSPDAAAPQGEPLMPPAASTGPDTEPQPAGALPPAPAAASATKAPAAAAVSPDPDRDAKALVRQGAERPADKGEMGVRTSEVFAEDWWTQARPVFDIHGYYRVRAELFHHFAIGRKDLPGTQLWPQPVDNDYIDLGGGPHHVRLCGDDPLNLERCENNTQAGANMRFRLNPELHISDNLRVLSQIDLLDNIVLGSTPDGYANRPGSNGYNVVGRGGYSPLGTFASTQWAPSAGQNSLTDSVSVKRVWGEYRTPIGLLRFGRMPSHWGLGMFVNGGDSYDSDYQSTADRIMFFTGIKKYDIYFAAGWDFANEGPTSASLNERQGQPYDLGQYDDVNQYMVAAVRRRSPELERLDLANGKVVLNGGLYFVLRNQFLANDETTAGTSAALGESPSNISQGYVRRGAQAYIPDAWFQFLYKKFRFELEAAFIYGTIENTTRTGGIGTDYQNPNDSDNPGWTIQQFGIAMQSELKLLEDKLHIELGFGYATGDDDVDSIAPQGEGLQPQRTTDRTFSTFRFHPDYRVDMILFRNILTRVQGAYYFKPTISYDFTRNANGQRIGGGASLIWSRASQMVQAPGHKPDLGLELNFQLYYQAKDGTLNDRLEKMGGFYTALQYGVLFPLGGLGYLPGEVSDYEDATNIAGLDTETAQIVRWYLGILF
jgi:uncharacterized protein (TIGR04551 family)